MQGKNPVDQRCQLGIVVIGRNEGQRLQRCLRSIGDCDRAIVYVDSGSSDGSVEFAKSLGVDAINLDMSIPFTMARGRNAGFDYLMAKHSDLSLVQFIDGDCEVVPGYLDAAVHAIQQLPDAVVVTGRRMERHPDASAYNRLCDLEWGEALGEVTSCGGDMLVRSDAFMSVGKFNEGMIAGEEPELCVRIRLQGGKIYRIDHDMTLHDAAMTRFSQWWKRAKRAGHAYAEGAALHGNTPFRHKVREVRSSLFWGGVVPIFSIVSSIVGLFWPWAWLGTGAAIVGYGLLVLRIQQSSRRRGWSTADSFLYAFFCVLSKPAAFLGICQYWWNQWRGTRSTLIEYKGA